MFSSDCYMYYMVQSRFSWKLSSIGREAHSAEFEQAGTGEI
jgi:hypothetical protein